MKLFNTAKKKIVAGTLAVAVVAGGGVGLANTDAGTQLQKWYSGQFTETASQIGTNIVNYGKSLFPKLHTEFNGIAKDGKGDIYNKKDDELSTAKGNIEAATKAHISDVDTQRDLILRRADEKFDDIFKVADGMISDIKTEGNRYADSILKGQLGDAGSSAKSDLESQLDLAKDSAVNNLNEAIKSAKKTLSDDLKKHADNNEEKLIKSVDDNIKELRKEVNNITDKYVSAQKELIADAATTKTTEATNALDEVVKGINNNN